MTNLIQSELRKREKKGMGEWGAGCGETGVEKDYRACFSFCWVRGFQIHSTGRSHQVCQGEAKHHTERPGEQGPSSQLLALSHCARWLATTDSLAMPEQTDLCGSPKVVQANTECSKPPSRTCLIEGGRAWHCPPRAIDPSPFLNPSVR